MAKVPMTKADFAETMGVDRAQATRWAELGMPVLPDGRVDAPKAALWVRAYIGDAQRTRRSTGARAIRAGEAMRADDAVDDLVRCGLRLAISMVPTLVTEIATEAKMPAAQIRRLEMIARSRAPLIEAAVRELMDIPPNAETGPLVKVSHPLPIDVQAAA